MHFFNINYELIEYKKKVYYRQQILLSQSKIAEKKKLAATNVLVLVSKLTDRYLWINKYNRIIEDVLYELDDRVFIVLKSFKFV